MTVDPKICSLEGERGQVAKEAGNKLFLAGEHVKAAKLYEQAIECVLEASDGLPRVLLQNIAAVALHQKAYITAFFYAGAVTAFEYHPSGAEAFCRSAESAFAAGEALPGLWPTAVMLRHGYQGLRDAKLIQDIDKVVEHCKSVISDDMFQAGVCRGGRRGDQVHWSPMLVC